MSGVRRNRRWLQRWVVPVAAGGLPFLVYLRTMAPTVYGLDSAELTTAAYVLGIVHSPGSPTFILLGHAFTWLPLGDVGYRVNLLSVCCAAGGIALLAMLTRRLTGSSAVGIAGAWTVAFSFYYWISALAAELYAPLAFSIAALLCLAQAWRDEGKGWHLCAFTALYGVALGNHTSLSVLIPGFAYLLFAGSRRPNIRLLMLASVCGISGLAVYLYLPLRALAGTPLNYARDYGVDVSTWQGFLFMLRGGMFQSWFLAVPVSRLPTEIGLFIYRLWSNFLGIGCLVGFVGLLEAPPELRTLRRATLLMLLGHLGFLFTYAVIDKEFMLAPDYLLWGLWVILGARPAAAILTDLLRDRLHLTAASLLLLLAGTNLMVNYGLADISDDWSARTRGERILDALDPKACFIGTWGDAPILQFLQLVEGRRTDVEALNLFFLRGEAPYRLASDRLLEHRSLYTSSLELFARRGFDLEYEPDCECYRIVGGPLRSELSVGLQCHFR